MEHGFVNLHGTLISSFMTGLSWLQCYFQPMRRREDTLVLGKHQKRAALLCPECQAVHIRGNVRE
jgi:hypothetical protein